ncbi:MAG TPA: HAD family hydrolase [Acidimicrobiia bacterium]|nr:HAD family hydrolase [Acidimicrobiia bacterium]
MNKMIPPRKQAAFFDLDKTIIAKSSMLAFSKTFRKHGLLNRRTLVRAAYAQVVFQLVGANEKKMERIRQVALNLTKGWNRDRVSTLVQETLHEVVIPIIFDDAVELIEHHKREGRHVVIVSSAPHEVVEPIATHLGVDDFIATTSRLDAQGNYTGELEFYSYGHFKPEAVLKLAAQNDIDLNESFAYSDSITDIPLLECVGHPVAVNPDRELARIANEREWPIVHFTKEVTLWERIPVQALNENKMRAGLVVGITTVLCTALLFRKRSKK